MVGNRLSDGSIDMEWDAFNRLGGLQASNGSTYNCYYLPGGLRSTKIFKDADDENDVKPSGFYDEDELENFPTARYRYDGQMTLEEDTTDDLQDGTFIDETRYTLGARGIEAIEAERLEGQDSEGVVVGTKYRSFPVYDGHGNMIATLHREASDTYSIKNEKRYNAWGAVRSYSNGGANLNPNKAYVANLGHTLDWETGLIYMRARYYEPSTGRFISQDPGLDGCNWYMYAANNPIMAADASGKSAEAVMALLGIGGGLISMAVIIAKFTIEPGSLAVAASLAALGLLLTALGNAIGSHDGLGRISAGISIGMAVALFYTAYELAAISVMTADLAIGLKTSAAPAFLAIFLYSLSCMAILKEMDIDDYIFAIGTAGPSQ